MGLKNEIIHNKSTEMQDEFLAEKDPVKKDKILAKIIEFVKPSLNHGCYYGGGRFALGSLEDIQQCANLDLIRCIRNETGSGSAYALAFRIGLNAAANYTRRMRRRTVKETSYETTEDDRSTDFYDPIEDEDRSTIAKSAVNAIESLSYIQKRIIEMSYFEDRTIRQCARELGIPYPKAYYQRITALNKLKQMLKEININE